MKDTKRVLVGIAWLTLAGLAVARWARVQQHDAATSFPMPHSATRTADWRSMRDTIRQLYDSLRVHDVFNANTAEHKITDAPAQVGVSALHSASAHSGNRPAVTVKAIAGPPWLAIVDGLPGQSREAIVRPGAVFGDLVVRSIMRDTIVVQSAESSWVLTMGRPR